MCALDRQEVDRLLGSIPPHDKPLADLAQTCLSQPSCAKLLHFLCANPSTLMTVPDISGCLGLSQEETHSAIDTLYQAALLRQVCAGDFVFYGLSDEADNRALVKRFRVWCEDQRNRLKGLRGVL